MGTCGNPKKVFNAQTFKTVNFSSTSWTFRRRLLERVGLSTRPSPAHFRTNPEKFGMPTQTWTEHHFPDFIKKDGWSVGSPDLNPFDYFLWDFLENKVNAQTHMSIVSLKAAITQTYDNLDQDMIDRAIDDWSRRLDAAIAVLVAISNNVIDVVWQIN